VRWGRYLCGRERGQAVEHALIEFLRQFMKNLVLFLAFWAVMTPGAYAQGQLSPDESNPDPNQSYQAAHQTTRTKDVVSSEGLISTGPELSKAKLGLMDQTPVTSVLAEKRISLRLDDAAWEESHAEQGAVDSAGLEELLSLEYPALRSKEPRFSPSNFRAWDYGADDSDMMTVGSIGGVAAGQNVSAQSATAGSGAGAGSANNSAASTGPSAEEGDLVLMDAAGPHRLVISNIASPEPNTVALGLLGGAALGWRRLARRRENPRGGN
jgi:hypothetical protein